MESGDEAVVGEGEDCFEIGAEDGFCEKGSWKKSSMGDLTLTFWTSCHDSSSEREQCSWMIISRIAVREIPANSRLASHERIGNYFRCVSEYRELCLYRFRRLELVFACKGADFQVAVAFRDIIKGLVCD